MNAAPITLAELPDYWVAERREIIARDGYRVRADSYAGIEIETRAGAWVPLMLPGGARRFVAQRDRDEVLRDLTAQ